MRPRRPNKPRRVIHNIDELPVLCDCAEAGLLLRRNPEVVAKLARDGVLRGAKQGQAVDALCLLLDGLEHEGRQVTEGKFAAENFVNRLRVYMGALYLIADTLEDTGNTVEELAGQLAVKGGEQRGKDHDRG